jgi:two-component system, response regulator PdtaR
MTSQGILIVQRDFLLAECLRQLLADAGYEVVGMARDTAGAEKFARQHRPALAVVDMMLELDVDGIATATFLKQNYGLAILITSGFPESLLERNGAADLGCAVVSKPYSDEQILAAVARCLNTSPS